MTSLATLRTELNEDYIRDPNNKVWNTDTKDRALNKWYQQVQKDLQWSEGVNEQYDTRSAVAGSELYDLPDDYIKISLVTYAWDELIRTTRKQTRQLDETPQSGTPRRYYQYNNKLGLYPVPDWTGTIGLYYYESEATLSSVQDSTLPSLANDAIKLYAAYKLFLWVRDSQSASLFLQDYEKEMNKLRMDLLYDDENMRSWYELYGNTVRDNVLDFNTP